MKSGSGDGRDGKADGSGVDSEFKAHLPDFMTRLRAAENKASKRQAPWEKALIEQANLREDMHEVKERLRSIEEGIARLAGDRPRSSDDD